MLRNSICTILALLAGLPINATARVVINEIFYHAPDDIEDLEYVELYNSADETVDLSGWSLAKGIKYSFSQGTRIAAKGYLVLCRNRDRFKEYYNAPVEGVFSQPLSNKGESLALMDPSGKVVDSVKYKDSPPWPSGADGHSGSLERICPEADGDNVYNWASSPLSADRIKPAGTPGKANANYSAVLPPIISKVKYTSENPLPNQSIAVEAEVRDVKGIREVVLLYRVAGLGFEKEESSLTMKQITEGHYAAEIPGQSKDPLVRFRIKATSQSGAARFFPAENELRPALSCYVHDTVEPARIPFGWIIDTTASEYQAGRQRATSTGFRGFNPMMMVMRRGDGPPEQVRFEPPNDNPNDIARTQVRKGVESGLDLAGAWFELTVHHQLDTAILQKVKAVFEQKFLEQEKLIDDLQESQNIPEKLNSLPSVIQTFKNTLLAALKPLLTEDQNKSIGDWLTKKKTSETRSGMLFNDPDAIVKSWVKLEGAWHAITIKADVDQTRLAGLRQLFQQLEKERNSLIADVAKLKSIEDGYRDIRENSENLNQKLTTQLKPLLSSSQEKQFVEWMDGPKPASGPPMTIAIGAERGPFGGPGPGMFGDGPQQFRFGPGGPRGGQTSPASYRSAFVYFDPASGGIELYDFVKITPRAGGQKVHFHKDRLFHNMAGINLIYESDTAVLVEPLAYEVYRKVGVAAEQSYHVRLWIDGSPAGYYLLVEQPDRAFLRRNKISDDGNLYKLLWYGQGIVGQHEKKTHTRLSHDDIVDIINKLEKTSGDEQWKIILENFDVEEVVNYFAASMALSNWDGFFNNYYAYHDIGGSGKWTMYPWDEDQTWGTMNMMGGEVFFNMPITFGMKGDVPPGQSREGRPERGFGFGGGGAMWWRQPGWFSGPLLANPQFRKIFLARTKEILENVYTEKVFLPIIQDMANRLEPEIRFRAKLLNTDPERAVQDFSSNLQSIREHLTKRREFLLAQDEIKNAGKFSRADFTTTSAKNSATKKKKRTE